MNIAALVVPVIAAAAAWIVVSTVRGFRHALTLPELLATVSDSCASRMCPYVERRNIDPSLTDDRLWAEMGRREGIHRIRRKCGDIATLSIRFSQQYPTIGTEDMSRVRNSASYLRMTCWGAIAEDLAKEYVSDKIPRVQARAVAALYCDIYDTIAAASSIAKFSGTRSQ